MEPHSGRITLQFDDNVDGCECVAELDGKFAGGSEGQIKKKKLTSLLRSLSATAASSSARMTTKSSSGDESLMVDVQAVHREVMEEDEAEMKPGADSEDDVSQQQAWSSSVLRMFSLPRGSTTVSYTHLTLPTKRIV